ncbi:hypothetical protein BSPWISOXPB_8830 [uncultured Gammaproteobacteria bacterium]|nr:hypothetical protein BSPWISOXPB_8830 [uncultured Gammaproteobacteria bacterium]
MAIYLGGTIIGKTTQRKNGKYSMLIDINGDGLPDRVFDRNPKTDQQGFFVYLNTGDGFDNGKQWQAT